MIARSSVRIAASDAICGPYMSFGCAAARTLLEVLQLRDEIPIAHALEPRRIGCLRPAPVGTVARCAGFIELLAVARIVVTVCGAGLSGNVPIYATTLSIAASSASVAAIGAIILPNTSLALRAAGAALEILQFPLQVPGRLAASFGAFSAGLPSACAP